MLYIFLVLLSFISESLQDDTIKIDNGIIRIQQDGSSGSSSFIQAVNISGLGKNYYSCVNNDANYCLRWSDGSESEFKITKIDPCNYYEYKTNRDIPLAAIFDISGQHVYGGAERNYQTYPTNLMGYDNTPYVSTSDTGQSVLKPYWLFSGGTYILVEDNVPLFITFSESDGTFLIIAKREAPYLRGPVTSLRYRVCTFSNMTEAQQHAIKNIFQRPGNLPDTQMVYQPVWSTWARYRKNISQQIVLDYATEIKNRNFNASQLEINDNWESCYGSLNFDQSRFANPTDMIKQLKIQGYRVTLSVHPFINEDCEPSYSFAKNSNYLVTNQYGSTSVQWWNGNAGIIDFTNPEAYDWFVHRLRDFRITYNIDSFKFAAGESRWNPQIPVFNQTTDVHPESSLQKYVEAAAVFGPAVEMRVDRSTSNLLHYTRVLDLDSVWTGSRGLSSLIPTVLQFNDIGISYVIPDYVGGNGYEAKPDAELFIRWLQASVFMPVLQLSFAPWDFNNDTIVRYAMDLIRLHNKYAKDIESAMDAYVKTGIPVNRAIWWLDPEDLVAQSIGSEYLLGDNILVAPVLEKGKTSRDIYFPKGRWRDATGNTYFGPRWLNYAAPLNVLPYFTRVTVG